MNITRRQAVKSLSAMAAVSALTAYSTKTDVMSGEQIARLAERLFNTIEFWGHTTWFRPHGLPVEIRLPLEISNAVGEQLCELYVEMKRYCPRSTIVLTCDKWLVLTYFYNGEQYVARFSDVYYGDFLSVIRSDREPIRADLSMLNL